MGQLSALLHKNAALLVRKKKSLVVQALVIIALLFVAGIIGLLTGMGRVDRHGTPTRESDGSITSSCYGSPGDVPLPCTDAYWGLFTGPPEDAEGTDSPGVLSKDSYATGDMEGLLGRWPLSTAQVYHSRSNSDDDDDDVDATWEVVPFFNRTDTPDDMDKVFLDLMDAQKSGEYSWQVSELMVPNLGLDFASLDYSEGEIEYALQMTDALNDDDDVRYSLSLRSGSTRQWFMSKVASSFISEASGRNVTLVSQSVSLYNEYWIWTTSYGQIFAFVLVTPTLMMMLPLFVLPVVIDRANKTMELNKLMGMSMVLYWLSHLVFDYFIYLLEMLVVTGICTMFIMPIIFHSATVTIPLWIVWGFTQVSLGLFVGAIFKDERSATLVSYLVMFLTIITAYPLNIWVFANGHAPLWYIWFPPWTYVRAFFLILNSYANGPPMYILNMSLEFFGLVCLLLIQGVVMLLLAGYFEQVAKKDWGMRRPYLYPVQWILNMVKPPKPYSYESAEASEATSILLDGEGDDCKRERQRAEDASLKFVMNCVDVHKSFKGKPALHRLSLAIENEETFGLLGPNGAGKTTRTVALLSILSGMLHPDSGTAYINGYNIITESSLVQSSIGICPQFDILWDDLTVDEHIRFYIRMKGVKLDGKIHVKVNDICEGVGLAEHMNKTAGSLSGGMRRKLSIAIALVGDPRLIMLDEPSSGLDPEARRDIWDIISEAQEGRSFIITTHNMEEADVLCSRIGILTRGKLACIGTQLFLKNRYGKGYSLHVNCRVGHSIDAVDSALRDRLPWLARDYSAPGRLAYLISNEDLDITTLFNVMHEAKESLGVQDFSLSQTTLEEVFLNIVEKDEAAAENEALLH